ncbi:MAG TPA: multidrug ABC transporter permease [Candidatus Bathyarchaeota archaeon]|nr:multidrug ABC transporter permease [Candidatus Bathyarchaeota archaeon]HEX69129.1 multidrug ABC transporter permease [Candidatus Bathyarchaeota archaeon]
MEEISRSPLHGLWALTNRELKKWYKEPFIFFISIIQPIIWMGLFGKAMNINAIITNNLPPNIPQSIADEMMKQTFGTSDYFSYMAVGMLSFVTLFTTMFSGMSIVWDRRLGFLNKVLSTPVARSAIIFSKILSATIRSLVQVSIILVFAFLLGLQLSPNFTPINLLGVYAILFLLCMGLSSLFLMLGIRSTRWETQMAIVNLLNLPLMFASNALFPTNAMPDWLKPIANVNPITYTTDAVRQLLIFETPNLNQLMLDFTYMCIFAAAIASISIILSWKYLSK